MTPQPTPTRHAAVNVVPLRGRQTHHHSGHGLHRVNTWATEPDAAHQLTPAEAEMNTRVAAWEARQRATREQAETEQRQFEKRTLWVVSLIYGAIFAGLIGIALYYSR